MYLARQSLFDGFMDRYFPNSAAPAAESPALPTALADAQLIAGRYESSRRIETDSSSLFDVLQQSVITANADGTISAPGLLTPEPETISVRSAPQLWRRVDGTQQLMLQTVSGVKTVADSTDPTSVLQAVPLKRSSVLNLTALTLACLILLWTLLAWLLSHWLKAPKNIPEETGDGGEAPAAAAAHGGSVRRRLSHLLVHGFAADAQSRSRVLIAAASTPVIGTLEAAGLLADPQQRCSGILDLLAPAKTPASRAESPFCSFLYAAGPPGVVWIGFIGGLIRFSLNY